MATPQQKQSWQKLTRLSQPANLSSHWTIALSSQGYIILVCLVTLFHFGLAAWLPLTSSEIYYWTWTESLRGGYFDAPPMVAYLLAFSTKIFGDNPFGIRFFACVGWMVILLLLGQAVRQKFVLQLFIFTPLVMMAGVTMGPEIPLFLFWTLYLLWLGKVNVILNQWEADPVSRVYHKSPVPIAQWILGGVILGLGILSKYTMLMAIPCVLLMLAIHYRFQAWILGFLFHLVVASLVALPLLVYNFQHSFSPFLLQWNQALISHTFSFGTFFENVWTQTLLIGAAPFLLFPWVLLRPRGTSENPALNAHFYLFVIPAVWFGYKAFTQELNPIWPVVATLAFWSLAQRAIDGSSFQGAMRFLVLLSFIPPLVCTGLILLHVRSPWEFISPSKNEMSLLFTDTKLFNSIAEEIPKDRVAFTNHKTLTAQLRFHNVIAHQFPRSSDRSEFTLNSKDPCSFDSIYVLSMKPMPSGWLSCFSSTELVKSYSHVVRRRLVGTLDLIRLSK